MRRLLRWRVLLLVVALVLVVGIVGVKLYTRSGFAARLVANKLEAQLGLPIRLGKLDVGLLGNTSVSDLRVYEAGAGADTEPMLAAADVDVNIGAVGAARGKQPSEIHLQDAHVLLRFTATGDLLTRLPTAGGGGGGDLPVIHIDSGTLTIRQAGREDSVFGGINLVVREVNDVVQVSGMLHDQAWGEWTAEGRIRLNGPGDPGKLVLQTVKPQAVTPELLRQVPFVNPSAWSHVQLSGTTTAKLELTFDPATRGMAYRVSLEPTGTTVEVPAIGLHFTHATGDVVAEGGVVILSDVHGQAADGEVRLDSRMDFAGPTDQLRFRADLSNMRVQKLPKEWRLPPGLDGRLNGKVEFTVTLPEEGQTVVEAAGRAIITDARLRGRAIPPVELDVQSAGSRGITFASPSAGQTRHEVHKVEVPPAGPRKVVPGRRPGLVSGVLRLAARVLKPAGAPAAEKAYLNVNIGFRDVDVAELLKTAGVEVPVKLGGKVTVRVQVDIPTDTPDEFRTYRLTGRVHSQRLTVDDLAVEGIAADLNFRDGKLSVTDFVGRLPGFAGANGAAGSFTARGEVTVGKDYPFQATVKLDQVPLESVEQLKSLLPASLRLAGVANVTAGLKGTLSPLNLRTSGQAQVKRLRVGPVPADDLTFQWQTADDMLQFKDVSARLLGGELSGSFEVPLRGDAAAAGSLKLQSIDLGALSKNVLEGGTLRMEGEAAGTIQIRSPAPGEGERGATAELDLQAPKMKLQGIPARKIKGTAQYRRGVLTYSLNGEALGGQFEVTGQYPPANRKKAPAAPREDRVPPKDQDDDGLSLGRIKLRGIQLARLWDVVGVKSTFTKLDADLSGQFPLTTDEDGRLVGTGRLRADRVRWGNQVIATAGQAIVRLTPTEMRFEEILLFVGEGVIRAQAVINRSDPDRSSAAVRLTNVPASRLLFLAPELAGRIDMPVSGRLTTSIGREWRGSGVLTSVRGTMFGIPVSSVRIPVDWTTIPDRGRTEVRVRDVTATAAGGQFGGAMVASFFNDLPPRLAGNVQFRNVNLSSAFRDAGDVIGNLPLSGKLEFGADQYRGPETLTANLRAGVGRSQPLALPVLSALIPYLGYGRDSRTTIDEGELRAALAGGVWRVQQLTLAGPSLSLFAEGTVTLGGRVNLNVIASTRSRPGQAVLQRFNPLTVAALATPTQPLNRALLADAASMLSSYLIYMEVVGTVATPIVKVNVFRTLAEGAVRFFLLRFLNPVGLPLP